MSTCTRYLKLAPASRSGRGGGRGGSLNCLVHRDRPFDIRRFDTKVEGPRILVDIGRIAAGASMVDGQQKRAPADVAIYRDLEDPRSGHLLLSNLPLQAKGSCIADERP